MELDVANRYVYLLNLGEDWAQNFMPNARALLTEVQTELGQYVQNLANEDYVRGDLFQALMLLQSAAKKEAEKERFYLKKIFGVEISEEFVGDAFHLIQQSFQQIFGEISIGQAFESNSSRKDFFEKELPKMFLTEEKHIGDENDLRKNIYQLFFNLIKNEKEKELLTRIDEFTKGAWLEPVMDSLELVKGKGNTLRDLLVDSLIETEKKKKNGSKRRSFSKKSFEEIVNQFFSSRRGGGVIAETNSLYQLLAAHVASAVTQQVASYATGNLKATNVVLGGNKVRVGQGKDDVVTLASVDIPLDFERIKRSVENQMRYSGQLELKKMEEGLKKSFKDLSQFFVIHTSVKDFSQRTLKKGAPLAKSASFDVRLGPIEQLFREFIGEEDFDYFVSALNNLGNRAALSDGKYSDNLAQILGALSAAYMFDDYLEIFTTDFVEETDMTHIHIYKITDKYVPLSYLLNSTYQILIKQDLTGSDSSPIFSADVNISAANAEGIWSHAKQTMPWSSLPEFERWSYVRDTVQKQSKISVNLKLQGDLLNL